LPLLDAWVAAQSSAPAGRGPRRRPSSPSLAAPDRSPLETHLPVLNLALCAVLLLLGLLARRGGEAPGPEYLPAVAYGAVLAAKVVMGEVDPERELTGLTYEYKGA